MRITYLLDRPELGGGTKVVAQHAQLLGARGHEVTVAAKGPRPVWFDAAVRYRDLALQSSLPEAQDLVVATYWTTIAPALQLTAGPVAHFCQGFEEDLEHLAPHRDAIRAAYRLPLPALVVSPHLANRLRQSFDRESRLAPAPADTSVRRRRLRRARRRPWIALCGIFEAEVKGIRTGLGAVSELARRGLSPRLLRISALPASAMETGLFEAERYLAAIAPTDALRALRGCDLLLFSSTAAEGFGLPLLEAMQLGVPAVASRIPGVDFMTAAAGARRVEVGDVRGFADAAEALLLSRSAWRRQRRQGIEAARRFDPARVGAEVEAAVVWAASAGSARGRGASV
ncbi:MAG: glycosyltransferase family 4 protein [Thermoanaerobaculia bacterium]